MSTSTFFRFAVAGAIATGVDMAVTVALIPWTPHYLWANTAGFAIANLVQFAIVHRWVFAAATRMSWREAYLASLGISLMGLVLSNVLVFMLVDYAHCHILLAKLVTAFATLLFNFGLRRMLVYASRP